MSFAVCLRQRRKLMQQILALCILGEVRGLDPPQAKPALAWRVSERAFNGCDSCMDSLSCFLFLFTSVHTCVCV